MITLSDIDSDADMMTPSHDLYRSTCTLFAAVLSLLSACAEQRPTDDAPVRSYADTLRPSDVQVDRGQADATRDESAANTVTHDSLDESDGALDALARDGARPSDVDAATTRESVHTIDGVTLTLRVETQEDGLRMYTLTTDAELPLGAQGTRRVEEQEGQVRLRSARPLVDALFALAIAEAEENATSTLNDAGFDGEQACDCYTTGALWNWVWTRDIAYAVDLALAWLDPERAEASLRFKLSEEKQGGGLRGAAGAAGHHRERN